MACLGTHFVVPTTLGGRGNHARPPTPPDVIDFMEDLESQYGVLGAGGWVNSTEKAWDGIHRCLTDGKLETGSTPAHLCILGADEHFWVRREDRYLEWIVNLLEPSNVRRVADAIRDIDLIDLRRRYD